VQIDRVTKREFFQRVGVPDYWVVDIDARVIEWWRTDDIVPAALREQLEWSPTGSTTPMRLDLPGFFAKVCE
jgi:Uma2 family endonuclease